MTCAFAYNSRHDLQVILREPGVRYHLELDLHGYVQRWVVGQDRAGQRRAGLVQKRNRESELMVVGERESEGTIAGSGTGSRTHQHVQRKQMCVNDEHLCHLFSFPSLSVPILCDSLQHRQAQALCICRMQVPPPPSDCVHTSSSIYAFRYIYTDSECSTGSESKQFCTRMHPCMKTLNLSLPQMLHQ